MDKIKIAKSTILLLVLFFYSCSNTENFDREKLGEAIKNVHLEWTSYQEDIKAQLGASNVAQWNGDLASASITDNKLKVVLIVEGTWQENSLAIPVLLRGPYSKVYHPHSSKTLVNKHEYIFKRDELTDEIELPWIEIHFPHTEKRIVLVNGKWESPDL